MDETSRPVVLPADPDGLTRAAGYLREGRLVAVPTETVYGLAARADSAEAVAAIYRAKGRPDFNPLIVHVADVAQAERLAHLDDRARRLAQAFWPGPLTMVLPLRDDAGLATAVTAGLRTVALRCPRHPAMRALLASTGLALAAPSANRSGGVSPTRAGHVLRSLGSKVDCILDAGACDAGIESTIVALRQDGSWQVLRPGPITESDLAQVLGAAGEASPAGSKDVEAPGQLASHYAPGKPVRLNVRAADPDAFQIGFGSVSGDFNLSPAGDLAQAASRLYDALHQAAESVKPRVTVAPIPEDGIGTAINDRLRRAAA